MLGSPTLAVVMLIGLGLFASIAFPADAPPAFFLVAMDDTSHVGPVIAQLERYRQAKRPVEVHLYARGGHGFKLGSGSKLASIKNWPQRLSDWLADSGFLNAR